MKNLIKCIIVVIVLGLTTVVDAQSKTTTTSLVPKIAVVVEEVVSEDSGFRTFQIKTTENLQTEEVEQYEVKGLKKVSIEGNSKLINALYNKQGLLATKVEVVSNNIFLSFHLDILKKYKVSDCNLVSIFRKVSDVISDHTERSIVSGGFYSLQHGQLESMLPCAVY